MFTSDAAAEPFKSDSSRWKEATNVCGQWAEIQESRDEFSTRERGRHGEVDKVQSGKVEAI